MKNNDLKTDQDFERELKNKMNELSASVDCFDRISARAFPENGSDFSDSEFTVSDLENVTGRSRSIPFLKWAAVAAAAVLFVGVIPKTAFFYNFFANLSNDSDKLYRSVVSEITSETEEHEYAVYDMPLEEYIKNDVLITPLYSCPFEECEKTGMSVRIFIRKADTSLTNQIYAVEYTGEYAESNIIAAAKSKATFTDEEIEDIEKSSGTIWRQSNDADTAALNIVRIQSSEDSSYATENIVSSASFSYNIFFKDNKISLSEPETTYFPLETTVIYYPKDEGGYFYDMSCTIPEKEEGYYEPDERLWKTSLYYDGSSAFPEESGSEFERTELFNAETDEDVHMLNKANVVNQPDDDENQAVGSIDIFLNEYDRSELLTSFDIPYGDVTFYIQSMRLYSSSSSDVGLKFKFNGSAKSSSISLNGLETVKGSYTAKSEEAIQKEISQLEEERRQAEENASKAAAVEEEASKAAEAEKELTDRAKAEEAARAVEEYNSSELASIIAEEASKVAAEEQAAQEASAAADEKELSYIDEMLKSSAPTEPKTE